jgi:BirA family biotin operon repressor/biotin-[acetyl-CoA-carboxylase] ligase
MAVATLSAQPVVRERLIGLLADGGWHSGEQLARSLGVSRTAVWKALKRLDAMGVAVERRPRQGYRWRQHGADQVEPGLELLDAGAIRQGLSAASRARLRNLDVVLHTDSTNQRLLEVQNLPAGRSDVYLAEYQSAGRGRRGREWIAPFGNGLCLSVSRMFADTPPQLGALSLAAGVAVLRALSRFAIAGVGLKWPNDLLFRHRKLGGILTELRAEGAGPVYVVVGVGINLHLTPDVRERLGGSAARIQGMEAAALCEASAGVLRMRNALAAGLVDELIAMMAEYQRTGLHAFAAEWRQADALLAAPVHVLAGEQVHGGLARGIDEEGALLVEVPGRLLRFTSGEVSLRTGESR